MAGGGRLAQADSGHIVDKMLRGRVACRAGWMEVWMETVVVTIDNWPWQREGSLSL